MKDWKNQEIEIGLSKGGVKAVSHPFENLISSGIKLWPSPEIVQKMYKSNQGQHFLSKNYQIISNKLGYYCDLQSIHSEDAITWNVFGPVKYASKSVQIEFVKELLKKIDIKSTDIKDVSYWLWRRIPHPDTLVSGGPEIDFGVITDKICIIGEAKWLSGIGQKQGKKKDKTQIDLRIEFIKKYGNLLFPDIKDFIVLGLSPKAEIDEDKDVSCSHSNIHLRNLTWKSICNFISHPCRDELLDYYNWKKEHSKKKIKIVNRIIPEYREDRRDSFRVKYNDRSTFDELHVNIKRIKTNHVEEYSFNSNELPDKDSIYFSTKIIDSKMVVNWRNFIKEHNISLSDDNFFDDLLNKLKIKNQKLFNIQQWHDINLDSCNGKQAAWSRCKRGLYIFFDKLDERNYQIVRIGTHSIKSGGSNTTLWNRLNQHRGIRKTGGGNHRCSIFRLLVGDAFIQRDGLAEKYPYWDQKKQVPNNEKMLESELEIKVSNYIKKLPFIVLKIDPDTNGPEQRNYVEKNIIAYISNINKGKTPPDNWLGCSSSRLKVKESMLWNNNHIFEEYEPNFLKVLNDYIERMK